MSKNPYTLLKRLINKYVPFKYIHSSGYRYVMFKDSSELPMLT